MEVKFLDELRSKTQLKHKLLEQTAISKAIISPGVTLDQYEEYLQKIWCLHAPVEKVVHSILQPHVTDLAERKKSEKILLDLQELNSQPKNCTQTFLDAEFIPSIGFCLGILYVIEGSTLGGMHILKNLTASIGKDARIPTNFLNAYGQHTGSKWKYFLEILHKYESSATAGEVGEIIDGAVYGFNQTYKIFNA